MIPDKIYVRQYRDGDTSMFWDEEPHEDEIAGIEAVEYIRKETLLEWANDKLPVESTIYGFIGGYIAAYKEIIDKLNSM